ncbi:hypothetical protein AAFF_G00122630 [Aldrovandia affinis]|uniref:Uncharacterized protein n=1 Tax=Aldrovandia affinis TaxID=143900 RepID=A0AAD7RRU0_9TELE|nr:hypothetical protein AAFF_G00122630 [Aldrovandia affinis]
MLSFPGFVEVNFWSLFHEWGWLEVFTEWGTDVRGPAEAWIVSTDLEERLALLGRVGILCWFQQGVKKHASASPPPNRSPVYLLPRMPDASSCTATWFTRTQPPMGPSPVLEEVVPSQLGPPQTDPGTTLSETKSVRWGLAWVQTTHFWCHVPAIGTVIVSDWAL